MMKIGETFKLNDSQIKKVGEIINDNRARYIEMPKELLNCGQFVKVLQEGGQTIGQITTAQAFKL